MKRILVATIVGMATALTASAQGVVVLYNYSQPATAITYTGVAGIYTGTGLVNGVYATTWTIGLYAAPASFIPAATVNAAMAGDYGSGLVPILSLSPTTTGLIPGYPGLFGPVNVTFASANNSAVTLVVVAYSGPSYNASIWRAHSQAFEMPAYSTPNIPLEVGAYLPAFSVFIWPEPSSFALTALGVATLVIFRRSQKTPKARMPKDYS